jgi:hypothetical protein
MRESRIASLFGPPGGVAFFYPVIIISMTPTVAPGRRRPLLSVFITKSSILKTPRSLSCKFISSENWRATLPQRGAYKTFSAAG